MPGRIPKARPASLSPVALAGLPSSLDTPGDSEVEVGKSLQSLDEDALWDVFSGTPAPP